MIISAEETKRASRKREVSTARCVITTTPDSQVHGKRGLGCYYGKVVATDETKFVWGFTRAEALNAALTYAVKVLKFAPASIEFPDGFQPKP